MKPSYQYVDQSPPAVVRARSVRRSSAASGREIQQQHRSHERAAAQVAGCCGLARVAEPGRRATSLEAGQQALSEGRFDDARRAFEAALREAETPEAHEGLAHATMWHDAGAGVASLEDAHRLYLARHDPRGAGRAAFWLASSYLSLGQPAVASGWAERRSGCWTASPRDQSMFGFRRARLDGPGAGGNSGRLGVSAATRRRSRAGSRGPISRRWVSRSKGMR